MLASLWATDAAQLSAIRLDPGLIETGFKHLALSGRTTASHFDVFYPPR